MKSPQPPVVETPTPDVDESTAEAFLERAFGVRGRLSRLGSQQDTNFRVDCSDGRRWVLKIANRATSVEELTAQCRVLTALADSEDDLRVPRPFAGLDGAAVQILDVEGHRHGVLLLAFVPGDPIMDSCYLAPGVIAGIGALVGRVSAIMATIGTSDITALDRPLQWDLESAAVVVEALAPHVADESLRARVLAACTEAAGTVARLSSALRRQLVHGDVTDNNIVFDRGEDGRPVPQGVIDFGDTTVSWVVAEPAVAAASVLHHRSAGVASVLPLITAFDAERPLEDEELDAFWPLVVMRACVLVVSGYHQLAIDPENGYSSDSLARDLLTFDVVTSVPTVVATAAVRSAVGRPAPTPVVSAESQILTVPLTEIDLGVDQQAWAAGRWLEDDAEDAVLAEQPGSVITRYGEHRLSRGRLHSSSHPANYALHRELRTERAEIVSAPWAGTVRAVSGDALVLEGGPFDLHLSGLGARAAGAVVTGSQLGITEAGAALRVQIARPGVTPVLFAPLELVDGWLATCPDPGPLLGLSAPTAADAGSDLLRRRDRSFAGVQGHYYLAPPRIERGWQEHLIDAQGRTYVDMINNVTVLGHGNPAVAEAAADQWGRLNTNSRFHYAALVELSERLCALAPGDLDTVLLVNSGSEAVDLALRLAWAATGRRDTLALAESYHGWTYASDAITTSISDNPHALETRPAWVHILEAPNTYRGAHRGDDAESYASAAVDQIDALAEAGRPPAALLCEPYFGNGGGMPLPDGYLSQVYAAVRRHGGLCISDEVQVGLGRLGRWFWGADQQGVLPDIVTVAKGLGNGHPVGAVITRRDIADSLSQYGSFFASTGGSPVSARMGVTVLDALAAEDLPGNAARMGDRLRVQLEELMDRHELIGAVHGYGLYMGLELVRDRNTLEPATAETYAICERLLELGVVCQPMSERMCVLKIKPPMVITEESCDYFVRALDDALTHGW